MAGFGSASCLQLELSATSTQYVAGVGTSWSGTGMFYLRNTDAELTDTADEIMLASAGSAASSFLCQ